MQIQDITLLILDIGLKSEKEQIKICQDSFSNIVNYVSKKEDETFANQVALIIVSNMLNVEHDLNDEKTGKLIKEISQNNNITDTEACHIAKNYINPKLVEHVSMYVFTNPSIKDSCLNLMVTISLLNLEGEMSYKELQFIKNFF